MIALRSSNSYYVPLKRLKRGIVSFARNWKFLARCVYMPLSRIAAGDTLEYFNMDSKEKKYVLSYKKEKIAIKNPIYYNGHKSPENQVYFFENFVMSLPFARYYHDHPSVITEEGLQLALVSNHPELSQKEHALFHQLYLSKPKRFFGTGLILSTPNDHNYYHCLFQIAPKLWQLKQEGFDLNQIDHFFIEISSAKFQQEILAAVEFDKSKLVDLSFNPHIQVAQMLITSPFWRPEPWICRRLRDTFLINNDFPKEPGERIFVSRSKARYRRILNEQKIIEILGHMEFQVLCLEGMTIKQQAGIFNKSEIVISAHGAALSNIVFCKPNTTVIELRAELHQDNLGSVFEHISCICDLNHYTIFCKGTKNEFGSKPKFWDVEVDIKSLSTVLRNLMNTKKSFG